MAIGTKENVVAAGTIVIECGVNFLVVVDASYDPNALLHVPIPSQITIIGDAIGHQVLLPTQLVILTTHLIQVCAFSLSKNFLLLIKKFRIILIYTMICYA